MKNKLILIMFFLSLFKGNVYAIPGAENIVFDPQNFNQAVDSAKIMASQLRNGETLAQNIGDPSKRSELLGFLASNLSDCGFRKIKLPGLIDIPSINFNNLCTTYDNVTQSQASDKLRSFFDNTISDAMRTKKEAVIIAMKKKIATDNIAWNRAYLQKLNDKPEAETSVKLLEKINTSTDMNDTLRIIAGLSVKQLDAQEQLNVMFANYANHYFLNNTEITDLGTKEN